MTPTPEQVEAWAREAGLPLAWISESGVLKWSELQRFAALACAWQREMDAQSGIKLFYYQPEVHGPFSFFVASSSAEEAAASVNALRREAFSKATHPDTYSFGSDDFEADWFECANPGEVIANDNS